MRRLIGTTVASLMVAGVALATPLAVSAALLWTLTATPLAVGTGIPTTFTLTAANMLLGRIECVVVNVPANFSVGGVGVVGSTAGDSWVAARAGNRVTVWTTSGGDRLELLDSVTFTVVATAMSAGSLAWAANAYDRPDCSGSGSLLGIPPVVVVTGPAVTPSPSPTPVPAPTLTQPPPLPTPTLPTPTLPLPSATPPTVPLPTLPVPTIGQPTLPPATPRPDPTPSDGPAQSTASAPSDGAGSTAEDAAVPPFSGGNPGGGPPPVETSLTGIIGAPRVRFDEPALDLNVASLGLLGGVDVWAVPAATIAGPGLIVLLWVALQTGGVSLWIPAVRRLRGQDSSRAATTSMKVA